ncbi:MAG: class I SAM-dependent methyltransferase [Bacteroidetes bacterium]|nr:class I SAM-dependent methyltransferase [Bacteroidota bacterium]
MTDFWDKIFEKEKTNWGFTPSDSAIMTKDFFLLKKIKNILIPGIGYGRNAKIFHDNGINVEGIEISKIAIELAKSENGLDLNIHHGSVTDMPFDNKKYDGIFCYALIHLLNKNERKKFIQNCYNQLMSNGYMIFSVASKKASMFGNGRFLSKDRYEMQKGLNVFFYDSESVKDEFKDYGLVEFNEIDEPIKHLENEPPLKLIYVKCRKADSLD